MASENAIISRKRNTTPASTASRESFSRPATPQIRGITSDNLCDHCSRFDFGELQFSSESLDIYQIDLTRSYSGRPFGSCPLCKPFASFDTKYKYYRYECSKLIYGDSPSRRVVFFLSDKWGQIAAFAHKVPAEDRLPCAISLDIGRANMCLARKWVRFCSQKHEGTCGDKLEHVVPGLKVIDCISRKICVATHSNPYVALSYVWGSLLTESHELTGEAPQAFPRTIEDAMVVAKELGIPYLWVDRYCIDKNSQKEKHTMISNMDKIYSGAELTVVAAAGSDPQYGLPGVSTTLRHGISIDTFSHGTLLCWRPVPSEIRQSHWATRAWTYQEMLLSRRRLVFTDSQMLFQCCSGEFQERFNITAPSEPVPNMSKLVYPLTNGVDFDFYSFRGDTFPENGIGESAEEIYSRISEYTARKLSYPGDILNAFNGIFSAFDRRMQGYESHFWGIPILRRDSVSELHQWTESFVVGLCWRANEPCNRRPGLWPSWSWTTIVGKGVQFSWAHPEWELQLQNSLTYTFTHNTGAKESISDFVRGKRDYTEYDQCVDATTWVLQDCEIMMQQHPDLPLLGHPSFDTETSPGVSLDVHISKGELDAAYVAVFLRATEVKSFFLIAQEVEDGCLRRVGLVDIWHTLEVRFDSRGAGKSTWLPGPEPRSSFNEWKWKTVRLV